MKLTSLLLAFFLVLLPILCVTACGEMEPAPDREPEQEQQPPLEPPVDSPLQPPVDPPIDQPHFPTHLPTTGYDGASFHILEWTVGSQTSAGTSWIPWEEGDVEQEDGDMLASAVFERNAWVEQTFDVNVTKEYAAVDGNPGYFSKVRGDAGTSNDTYQLLTLRTFEMVVLIEEGLFADMNDYKQYLHTDSPWWVQDSVASFTLGSHLYVAASEMLLRDKGATAAMFFNQVLQQDFEDLPDFYELVNQDAWTLEEMIECCEFVAFSGDTDDIINSAEDVWGCTGSDSPVYYLFNSIGHKFAHVDEDGYIAYDFGEGDSIVDMKYVFDHVIYADWYMHEGLIGKQILDDGEDLFVKGNALFKSGLVKDLANELKFMTEMYGILPHPKMSIEQDDYSSLVWEHHDSVLGIPAFAADEEMCAVILEALSWESYNSVTPVFYDTILLDRMCKDIESKEMLKIIFDTRSYDPGLYWDGGSGLQGDDGLLRLSAKHSSDIAGIWASFKDRVDTNIQKVNDWIADKEY